VERHKWAYEEKRASMQVALLHDDLAGGGAETLGTRGRMEGSSSSSAVRRRLVTAVRCPRKYVLQQHSSREEEEACNRM